MRRGRLGLLGLPIAAAALLAACSSGGDSTVTVFAASSLTETVDRLVADYEALEPGTDIEVVYAGSTTLATQILEGGPADILLSANEEAIADIAAAGLLADGAPFAANSLAIVVPPGNPGRVESLDSLADGSLLVARCAAEVPCGRLTDRVLESAGATVEADTLEPNVRATLGRVQLGEVDAGFVYRTDALAAAESVEEVPLPEGAGITTRYVAGTIQGSDGRADGFLAYVTSPMGRATVESFGFGPP